MNDPKLIRIEDLKPGDRFKMDNVKYVVIVIADRIFYSYYNKETNHTGHTASFGLHCQAKVELIEP